MGFVISKALIMAIIAVESGGDNLAIGERGEVGCMQISEACLRDVNEVSEVKFSRDDRLDREKSIEIFRIYISRYCTKERLGRTPTDEDAARIWNSGPNGYRRDSTKAYWAKVKGAMP